MARSTFEGPILSGDQRFGALRDVGYAALAQFASLTFTNTSSSPKLKSLGFKIFIFSMLNKLFNCL